MPPSIHIIYASTGGNAEFVADTLAEILTKSQRKACRFILRFSSLHDHV